MSKIAKRALISSLIASTVVAQGAPEPTTEATRPCGHALSATSGPHAIPAAELLADARVHTQLLHHVQRSHGASPEEAEDAAQEAAMRALKRGIRSCCATTFAGWLRRTAQNVLFDMRKKQRGVRLPAESAQLEAMVGPSAESGPGDVLAVREGIENLLAPHDLDAMTDNKLAWLGSAIGEHLTAGSPLRSRRITKPLRLLEDLAPALAEL